MATTKTDDKMLPDKQLTSALNLPTPGNSTWAMLFTVVQLKAKVLSLDYAQSLYPCKMGWAGWSSSCRP